MLARLALAVCLAFAVTGASAAEIVLRPINPEGDGSLEHLVWALRGGGDR